MASARVVVLALGVVAEKHGHSHTIAAPLFWGYSKVGSAVTRIDRRIGPPVPFASRRVSLAFRTFLGALVLAPSLFLMAQVPPAPRRRFGRPWSWTRRRTGSIPVGSYP